MNSPLVADDKHPSRVARYLLFAAVVLLAAVAFIVVTPFALLAIGKLRPADWAEFSNEGQAYGGIASVFGILALAGVAVSIVLQSRESALSRTQALREAHSELFFKALDDPDLLSCWGPYLQGNFRSERQQVYTNLIVSFWYAMFEIENITDGQMSHLASEFFKAAPGRQYWAIAGPLRRRLPNSSRELKFVQIIDEEYRKALSAPTVDPPENESLSSRQSKGRATIGALGIGLVSGVILSGGLNIIQRKLRK